MKLFEPIRIGSVSVRNRVVMAPMNLLNLYDFRGPITQRVIDYYVERAKGEVGLIITGVFKVENEIEHYMKDEAPAWPIFSSKDIPAFAEMADYVHSYGTKIFIQLSAGAGRVADGEAIDSGFKPVSSSANPAFFRPDVKTKPLTTREVEKIVEAFSKASERVMTSEIDGIEVHGHEGYLIDQFTTSLWNKRNDKYGGDLEARLRFPIEIIERIKDTVGKNFPIIYRYGLKHFIKSNSTAALKSNGYIESGRDIKESLEIAKRLEKVGVDALHVDAGCYESMYWAHPPMYQPHGCTVDLTAEVKKNVKIPIIAVNRLDVPKLAEETIKYGKADLIALGRGLLADPYWPKKVRKGRIEDIRPCIGCQDGCLFIPNSKGRPLSCSVNPRCGRERLVTVEPTRKSKRVMIIGGGVAGMEAARITAKKRHKVTLYEKNDKLGGHLLEASIEDFKQDIGRLLKWYMFQLNKMKVKIHLNSTVTPEIVEKVKPDTIIIATGSTALIPRIPGITRRNVTTYSDYLLDRKKAGESVIVVGGGMVGSEAALGLAMKGHKVTLLEMLPEISTGIHDANRNMLLDMLAEYEIEIRQNTNLLEVKEDSVTVIKGSKKDVIMCDTVLLAVGLKPEKDLYESLMNKSSELYTIGDCKEPRKIHHAIWDGFTIASDLN